MPGHILLIIILGLLSYMNTFNAPFEFDDYDAIVQNPVIKQGSLIHPGPEAWKAAPEKIRKTYETRLVGYATLALNWKLGGRSPVGYHVFNLIVHILNAILLYLLVRVTFQTPALSGSALSGRAADVAFLAALIFVAHPIQTQAVTYIYQRFTSIATFFYLMSLYCYIRFRLDRRGFGIYLASIIAAFLAMKSKEISITLPVAIAFYEFSFFNGPSRKRLLPLVPYILMLPLIPIWVLNSSDGLSAATNHSALPRTQYFMTQWTVIVRYLRLIVLPAGQNLDYDFPIAISFIEPRVIGSLALLLALGVPAVVLHFRYRKNQPALGLLSFGIIWFFLTLSVESSVIVLRDVIFEHRAYLPMAGVCITLSAGVALMHEAFRGKPIARAISAAALVIPIALGMAAFARNEVWRTETILWQDAVAKAPGNGRAHSNLGRAYLIDGLNLNGGGIAYGSVESRAKISPGQAAMSRALIDNAIAELLLAKSLNPKIANTYDSLGLAYMEKGLDAKAREAFQEALSIKPELASARAFLIRIGWAASHISTK